MGRKYKCKQVECSKVYTTKPNLLRHVRMIHHMSGDLTTRLVTVKRGETKTSSRGLVVGFEDNEFECPFPGCYKYYQFRSRLKTHMRKHRLLCLLDTTLSLPDSDLFNFEAEQISTNATNGVLENADLPKLCPSRRLNGSSLPIFNLAS